MSTVYSNTTGKPFQGIPLEERREHGIVSKKTKKAKEEKKKVSKSRKG
jgi:hypothetical protein|tara:strand:- start:513 stop:656 length:144 start_codon:yes stop_codon:yes gene_type:complete